MAAAATARHKTQQSEDYFPAPLCLSSGNRQIRAGGLWTGTGYLRASAFRSDLLVSSGGCSRMCAQLPGPLQQGQEPGSRV